MRYLNDEDMKTVKKLIRGRMKGGIIFLLLVTLIFGFMFFAGIFGNSHSEPPTIFDFIKLGAVAVLFYFVGIKFLILDSLKLYQRLADDNYEIYIYIAYLRDDARLYAAWRFRYRVKHRIHTARTRSRVL